MKPCILHVDIDAFFASVEQRRNPRLRGKPVIVGSGVIASCSYEARRRGLRAGMPLHTARRLCPDAVILEGHCATYRCFAEQIFEQCRRISPNIETYLDEAYCDLTGTEGVHGHPLDAGRALKQMVKAQTGLSVTVGIGPNKMIAKMAGSSVKPDGLAMVREEDAEQFIRNLPVEKLPGVGHATHQTLRKLNIATVGELWQLSRESLAVLFGANGPVLYERCRGRDTRAVNEREIPVSISRETTFHRETASLREIRAMLSYLAERAARAMRGLGLQCGKVKLHIRYSDLMDRTCEQALPRSTALDRDVYHAALRLLERLHSRRVSLRLTGVTLSGFSPVGLRQQDIFNPEQEAKLADLYRCLDQLRRRFGHSIIVSGNSADLLGKLRQDSYGYILRTPSLTK